MSTSKEKSPNCADASNIYFALYHGANYVTLSEETAIGKCPVNFTINMNKIIKN
jgi:pyruvate kinase